MIFRKAFTVHEGFEEEQFQADESKSYDLELVPDYEEENDFENQGGSFPFFIEN